MISQYFNGYYTNNRTQRMVEDLVISSIQQYGFNIHYIPREIEKMNHSWGEDPASYFKYAPKVEVYVKDFFELQGEGLLFSKFGIEKRDKVTLQIARRRFDEIRTAKVMMENSGVLQNEDADVNSALESIGFDLETGNVGDFEINFEKPRTGDLIYFPIDQKLYEIKYVENRVNLFQFGKLQLFELECDLYEYSHERIETGEEEIDAFNSLSGDSLSYQLDLEDTEGFIEGEDGELLSEDYGIEKSDKQANNNLFTTETQGTVDFGQINPMVRLDKKKRW